MFALRTVRPAAAQLRSFSILSSVRKDFVQELYVKELKAYKPIPAVKDAHVGHVKSFGSPNVPKVPGVMEAGELASALEAYVAAAPAVVETATTTSESIEEGEGGAEEFLQQVAADIKHEAKH